MKKSPFRTFLVFAALIIALIYVYPTVGWMTLSEEARIERAAKWKEEDRSRTEPHLLRDAWRTVKRWSEFDRNMVINLGLDLQGGVHMVVGLDIDAVRDDLEERYPGWRRRRYPGRGARGNPEQDQAPGQ